MRFDEFEVRIEVDGQPLKEHVVERDPEKLEIRCWVVSEEGKNFAMRYINHDQIDATEWALYLDGRDIGSGAITGSDSSEHIDDSYPISATKRRLYTFGKLTLTEDEDSGTWEENRIKQLGTIKVKVREGTEERAPASSAGDVYHDLANNVIHEKVKKAATHCVVGGAVIKGTTDWSRFSPYEEDPVTFVFQYGPKEMLQARDIIPQDEVKAEGDEVNSDNEKVAKTRIQELEEELALLNARSKAKGKTKAGKSKRGGRGQRTKMEEINTNRFFAAGEVIDLT